MDSQLFNNELCGGSVGSGPGFGSKIYEKKSEID